MSDNILKAGSGAALAIAGTLMHTDPGCREQAADICAFTMPHVLHANPVEPEQQVLAPPVAAVTSGSQAMPVFNDTAVFQMRRTRRWQQPDQNMGMSPALMAASVGVGRLGISSPALSDTGESGFIPDRPVIARPTPEYTNLSSR
jgi:hypothetical protein